LSILISEDVWGPAFDVLAKTTEISKQPELWQDPVALKTAAGKASALVVRNRTQVTKDLLSACPNLKVVARAGVGLDNIDVQAADELGIAVVAGLGANAVSVGEMALGFALSLMRNIVRGDVDTRGGQWRRDAGRELSGSTWGLVGCGATGLATAKLLAGFDCRILGFDPAIAGADERLRALEIHLVGLEEVLSKADVVSLHAPAVAATHHMINAQSLASMKPTAFLINVARGELVDETALIHALESGQIAGAGLDVRGSEPPQLGKLETLPNVVLAPHVAGITNESQRRITDILAQDIARALAGEPLQFAVGRAKN